MLGHHRPNTEMSAECSQQTERLGYGSLGSGTFKAQDAYAHGIASVRICRPERAWHRNCPQLVEQPTSGDGSPIMIQPLCRSQWPTCPSNGCAHSSLNVTPRDQRPGSWYGVHPRLAGTARTVLDGLVGDGVLRQVGAHHVRLDLHLPKTSERPIRSCQRHGQRRRCFAGSD